MPEGWISVVYFAFVIGGFVGPPDRRIQQYIRLLLCPCQRTFSYPAWVHRQLLGRRQRSLSLAIEAKASERVEEAKMVRKITPHFWAFFGMRS